MEESLSNDSLSGENLDGRIAGEGSSPSRSTKLRKRVWKRLRFYDRKCSKHKIGYLAYVQYPIGNFYKKDYEKYIEFDLKRKEVRNKLKNIWKEK